MSSARCQANAARLEVHDYVAVPVHLLDFAVAYFVDLVRDD